MRPLSCSVTSTWPVPLPALRASVRVPYEAVGPYSTYQLVASPPGSTLPVTTAVVAPTDVAGPVVAAGGFASGLRHDDEREPDDGGGEGTSHTASLLLPR